MSLPKSPNKKGLKIALGCCNVSRRNHVVEMQNRPYCKEYVPSLDPTRRAVITTAPIPKIGLRTQKDDASHSQRRVDAPSQDVATRLGVVTKIGRHHQREGREAQPSTPPTGKLAPTSRTGHAMAQSGIVDMKDRRAIAWQVAAFRGGYLR